MKKNIVVRVLSLVLVILIVVGALGGGIYAIFSGLN